MSSKHYFEARLLLFDSELGQGAFNHNFSGSFPQSEVIVALESFNTAIEDESSREWRDEAQPMHIGRYVTETHVS